MNEYQRVLRTWAMSHAPRAVKILDVKFDYEPGGHWSSYTYEDPSFKVVVDYLDAAGAHLTTYVYDDELTTMGTMLTELFKIAETEQSQA